MMLATGSSCLRLKAPLASPKRLSRRPTVSVTALTPPEQYGWVLTSVAFTAAVVQWQAVRAMEARKEFSVPYPTLYLPETDERANRYNCAQRAHQNSVETIAQQLAMQMLVGLIYPRVAAVQGAVWAFGRILYTLGYSTGDPSKRQTGSILGSLSYLGMIIATAVIGVRVAMGV